MIRAVVFDLDGVLCDCRDWHFEALNLALVAVGAGPIGRDEHERVFDGMPTRDKLAVLVEQGRLDAAKADEVRRLKQLHTEGIVGVRCKSRDHFGVQDVVRECRRRGLRVAVATNAVARTAHLILRLAGLYPAMDAILSNEAVEKPKPAPDIYRLAALCLRCQAHECLAVEDGQYGVQAAEAAGCKVLKVSGPADVTEAAILKAAGL